MCEERAHLAGRTAETRAPFTPLPRPLSETVWKPSPVYFLIELFGVVTSELRAPFVPDRDLKVAYL